MVTSQSDQSQKALIKFIIAKLVGISVSTLFTVVCIDFKLSFKSFPVAQSYKGRLLLTAPLGQFISPVPTYPPNTEAL